jgi:CTP synthase (UTP-ammonia lyase)
MDFIKIVQIGDYNDSKTSHIADKLTAGIEQEIDGTGIHWDWIETKDLNNNIEEQLSVYNGIWCVPGSPYYNIEGVISAIKFARESEIPYLGTCAGFQHAIIEFSRNVAGIREADHLESNPDAKIPVISLLECPLVEKSDKIFIKNGTRLHEILQKDTIEEIYHCRYGVNKNFEYILKTGGIEISARSRNGEVRGIELKNHPFFIATLFQIERSSLKGEHHPIIRAFLEKAVTIVRYR